MRYVLTNQLGKRTALIGLALLILTAFVGYQGYGSIVHAALYPWYAIAAGLVGIGMYMRAIGAVIYPLGLALVAITIIHALLLHAAGLDRLSLRTLDIPDTQLELFAALVGAALTVLGYFFRRTAYEEQVAAAQAAAPRCPNCGTEEPGGMYTCLSCGGTACSSCSGGLLGSAQSCPHCGESRQDQLRFHDTGTSY